jgi:hypothetical protein
VAEYPKGGSAETDPVASPAVTAEQTRAQAAETAEASARAAGDASKQDAATAATDAELDAATAVIYADELLVAKSLNSPMQRPILSGQFTPQSSRVLARFDIVHDILEPDGCWVPWHLFIGPTNIGMLTPKKQGDPLAAGVTRTLLGSSSGRQAGLNPEVLLTGLTPGQTYAFELTHGLVGGAGVLKSPGATYMACSDVASPWPDGAFIIAVKDNAAPPNLRIYKGQHTIGKFTDTVLATFVQPVAATVFGRLDVTPDGTRVVICNQLDGAVKVYTTGLLDGTPAASQARVPFAAPTTTVVDVVCMPDNATAWVIGGGQYYAKLDLATGAFVAVGGTTYFALGAGTGVQQITASPDGAYVYISCATSGVVKKVRTADGVVVATSAVIAGVKAIAVSPDGASVFAATSGQNPNKVAKLNAADLTTTASVNISGGTHNAEAIDVFPDGRTFLVAASNVAGGGAVKQYETADLSNYTNWPSPPAAGGAPKDALDIAITQNGTIYTPDQADGLLGVWFGGSLVFTPSDNFWDHVIRARFKGAR